MPPHSPDRRRQLLAATALVAISSVAEARSIRGVLPWSPNEAYPPERVVPGSWRFFTADEAAAIEAMANRLIPADNLGAGGAGCATYLDGQLAAPMERRTGSTCRGPLLRAPTARASGRASAGVPVSRGARCHRRALYGPPLLRMTFGFPENERKLGSFAIDKCEQVMRAMGANQV